VVASKAAEVANEVGKLESGIILEGQKERAGGGVDVTSAWGNVIRALISWLVDRVQRGTRSKVPVPCVASSRSGITLDGEYGIAEGVGIDVISACGIRVQWFTGGILALALKKNPYAVSGWPNISLSPRGMTRGDQSAKNRGEQNQVEVRGIRSGATKSSGGREVS